mmetsp:Transcript_42766/g.137861  ORF Transcript_42766/g.137861 Transcript_42766/m.137861 type:complete len:202 (+) Transcript_42766:356-961(+)
MTTKSSPGSSFQLRTSELCRQSSQPGKRGPLARGYWNSPAAQTTYRLRRTVRSPPPSSPAGPTSTSKLPSGRRLTASTSVPVRTASFARSASARRYRAYCSPVGCSACSVNAGDVPYTTLLRSKDFVQPCWLKEGEMKRISLGQRRKDSPTPPPRSTSSTRCGRSRKTLVSRIPIPTPEAPAPTMRTSSGLGDHSSPLASR